MQTVTSKDGTVIAYDRYGDQGPVLVMVQGAFSRRRFPLGIKLAKLLAEHYTVINYDRRGRGDSTDTQPYAIDREIEDLEAVIDANGGSAYVWGLSSGAILSLKAAVALGSSKITKLAVHEPPFITDNSRPSLPENFLEHTQQLAMAAKRGELVKYFMVDGMGAPRFIIPIFHLIPGAWRNLTAVANTLPYDAALTSPYQYNKPLAGQEWTSIDIPTVIMVGTESPAWMRKGNEELVPFINGSKLVAKKGLGHLRSLNVTVIAPVLTEFFGTSTKEGK